MRDNMNLSDSFKEYSKAYRKFRSEAGKNFDDKLYEIIDIFDNCYAVNIEKYELLDGDKNVYVLYGAYGRGEYYTEEITFPAYLLDMSRFNIVSEYKKITEERRKEAERRDKIEKEKAKQEKERKERREYERLKKKYEG